MVFICIHFFLCIHKLSFHNLGKIIFNIKIYYEHYRQLDIIYYIQLISNKQNKLLIK